MPPRFWRLLWSHVCAAYAAAAVLLLASAFIGDFDDSLLCAAALSPLTLPVVLLVNLDNPRASSHSILPALAYIAAAVIAYRLIGRSTRRDIARYESGHCIQCGYDLRAASSPHCPECGHPLPFWQLRQHKWTHPPDPPLPPTTDD